MAKNKDRITDIFTSFTYSLAYAGAETDLRTAVGACPGWRTVSPQCDLRLSAAAEDPQREKRTTAEAV